ncbi:glycosyltransferase [Planomonospora corallina]
MRVLLSTIGSRGDVQPVVALASRLRSLGEEVRVCAPPDFREWIDGLGIPVVPLGPELRGTAAPEPAAGRSLPSPEDLRRQVEETVAAQFATVGRAARGCDVLVACGALQVAARSVAETLEIPYVHASYCPVTLPSPHHAPPPMPGLVPPDGADDAALWELDAQRWNAVFGAALNAHRASAGLEPVTDVRGHVFTDRPWLAADPVLGPWPGSADLDVVQTGAWILPDPRPLPDDLEAFLDAGDPPVYFGLGSMPAPGDIGRVMVQTARELGRRAVVSRGWAGLSPVDGGPDCFSVGEVNQQALFRRVAAVVHHGGAGTTTAAARAGAPQVVIPQVYDQPYWARRVADLGIGAAHAPGPPTVDSLAAVLARALEPGATAKARAVAAQVRTDGADAAARLLAALERVPEDHVDRIRRPR